MKYSISLSFKYLPIKLNWVNSILHLEKWNLDPIGNSMHAKEYLALGEALLAIVHLKV